MADGSVIIRVEMETGGVQAGVDDIRAGCGRAASAAERTGRIMTRAMADGTRSMTACGESVQKVGTLVQTSCGKVRDGMNAVTTENGRTSASLEQMRASLSAVRTSLATAFGPVVTAAAPLLIKLSDLAVRAANAVARFFAILTGKSTYKRAVAAQDAITDSVAGTGAAAKEAARNLSGLDELNIWKENRDGSGGGGGGGASSIPDVDLEEVETGAATDFVVRLKDILFEWDDLNPELIAEKILTGLCAAAGGIIGYSIGGPLGGMVGLTLGALLGVKLSQVTFNGDGKLDKEETAKLIVTAVSGLIGGVLGFTIGGPKGAAIGFTIGAGVSVLISKALFNNDGKLDKEETAKLIVTAVGGLLGGILGFVIGGPKGAAIGFTIGAGVSVLIGKALFNNDGKLDKKETTELIITAVGGLLGGVLGFVIGGPMGAAIGFAVGAGVSVMIGEVLFDGDEKVTASSVVGSLVKALALIVGGAAIGFAVGGPLGAAIGMTIGVALTFAVLSTKWEDKDPSKIGPAGNNPFGDIGTAQKEFQEAVESGEYDPEKAIQDKLGDMLVTGKAKVDVEANFVESRDSLTDAQKTLPGKWNVTGLAPGLGADLSVPAQADFTSSRDSMTPEQKTVGVTARGTTWENGIGNPVIDTVAKFASAVMGLTKDQRTITTWSQYDAVKSNLTQDERTIKTWSLYDAIKSNLTQNERTIKIWAQYNAVKNKLTDAQKTISVKAKISEIVSSATSKIKSWLGLATGGIYKNGRWEPIEGYASGGNPRSARLFFANENGMPELVGRIGSSTAVMNNGQIVASVAAGVYRAVAAAFGQIGGWFSAMTARLGDIPPAIEMLANMPAQVPQPVMATGAVIPPRALYVDGPVQGLADAVSGIRAALERQGPERTGTGREPTYNVNLNVDGRTLLQAVLSQGRLRQLQSGGNPFVELGG